MHPFIVYQIVMNLLAAAGIITIGVFVVRIDKRLDRLERRIKRLEHKKHDS